MFEKLSIEFSQNELVYHFEHILSGMDSKSIDDNCVICIKLKSLSRHVPELKRILNKPKKELK